MKKQDIYTLLTLFVITTLTAYFSGIEGLKMATLIILALSGIKFLLVAFQFMELKKANGFWKALIIGYLVIFISTITIILH